MRCPSCNASNPEGAAFCGQCYERFDRPEPASAPDLDPVTTPTAAAATASSGSLTDEDPEPRPSRTAGLTAASGRFTATDAGLAWRCAMCDTTNEIGSFACSVCGARMDAEAPDADAPAVDLTRAQQLEAVLPGVGHLRTGHGGMGFARVGIVVFWLIGLLLLATGGVAGALSGLPLLLGMVVIWVTGPGDLAAAHQGRPPRLDARRFMYLVLGVTIGVIVAGGLVVIL